MRPTRSISWIAAARRAVDDFPSGARKSAWYALSVAADGRLLDNMKPLTGFGTGVTQISIRHRGDAYRVIIGLRFGQDVWVLHAFKKKSHRGSRTPLHEMDLLRQRIRRVEEICR